MNKLGGRVFKVAGFYGVHPPKVPPTTAPALDNIGINASTSFHREWYERAAVVSSSSSSESRSSQNSSSAKLPLGDSRLRRVVERWDRESVDGDGKEFQGFAVLCKRAKPVKRHGRGVMHLCRRFQYKSDEVRPRTRHIPRGGVFDVEPNPATPG
ncbi:hypothetical protein B0H14DRAFT_2561959 [Mycena olivaceomarginata]|nr:hypothetical protein B0H14DRAFT_2561959 [Mycena olivaceomarginata]